MAKVLYITANPKKERESVCLQVGRAFLNTYELINPLDEIIELDLYHEEIPFLDEDVFQGWQKIVRREQLTPIERHKLARINQLTDQFISADKYIFVTPMWNFGLPPKLKAYVDTICIAGKTFKYTDHGPVGLLTGKKAIHIQARGGVYSTGQARAMEFGDSYIRLVLGFMGITDVHSIIAEGTANSANYHRALYSAVQRAKKVAVHFARY
ncbi:FMN-dependent NADH-azoreductase [Hazenella coriacea]|uniref:FMN dependent NADH:quinone oxidoreductase n=1 Tax=Hazenella coriacea TaxID=1179467 RepID=A0A4V2UVN5_9BACL|nr:FMN-dependent NADH-azoreductase [Hazenella coriacea]TCS96447.1 FMN-dependent NADH-azoreductase [Hazenella coriacea]